MRLQRSKAAYRIGVMVAVLACFLTLWTTIVRDDGTGGTYFMLIMAVLVGWFVADFQAVGMARTMVGVAVMQSVNGLLVATAPVTAAVTNGSARAIIFNALFAALWLVSSACFHRASTTCIRRVGETA